jgi:DNA helicase-2/ATP-dependent DNA helicase PcrA
VLRWANEADITLFAALKRLRDIEILSAEGLRGLQKLARDMADVTFMTSSHRILTDYLFNRGGVFDQPLSEPSVAGQQRRLAVYQLLQVAYQYRAPVGRDPKREFLQHVRRLEILDEEKDLRKLPAAASGINAVRLMTVAAV